MVVVVVDNYALTVTWMVVVKTYPPTETVMVVVIIVVLVLFATYAPT